MLVGTGAGQFAQESGFPMENNDSLLAPDSHQAHTQWRQTGAFESPPLAHDTLGELHAAAAAGAAVTWDEACCRAALLSHR